MKIPIFCLRPDGAVRACREHHPGWSEGSVRGRADGLVRAYHVDFRRERPQNAFFVDAGG